MLETALLLCCTQHMAYPHQHQESSAPRVVEGLSKGLGRTVGDVDDLGGHGRGDDDAALLVLLLLPDLLRGDGRVKDAEDVDAVNEVEVLRGQIDGRLDD